MAISRRWIDRRGVTLGLCASPLVFGRPAANPSVLKPPVDVPERRLLRGRAISGAGCVPVPEPVRDLDIDSYYTDRSYSVPDAEKLERVKRQTRSLSDFCWGTAKASDVWVGSNPAYRPAAQCVLTRLDRWASADALLGTMSQADSQHQRKWLLEIGRAHV